MSDAWTDARIELLRQLNDKGPNSWIAKEINNATGSTFSRNAIIGKRTRMGLMQTVSFNKPKTESRRGKHSARILRSDFKRGPSRPADFGTLFDIANAPLPADFLSIPFEKLDASVCHYPRGDGPFVYCGQPVKEGSSYCPYCHSLCYQRPQPPSDRRDLEKLGMYLARRAA